MTTMITQEDKLKLRSYEEDLERKEEKEDKKEGDEKKETVVEVVSTEERERAVKTVKKAGERSQSDAKELISALKDVAEKKNYASLDDLHDMPLKTYQHYLNYNEAIRKRRNATRKTDAKFLYAPDKLIDRVKVKIKRTSNRGMPITLNFRRLKYAIWFRSPKKGFKDGEEIMMPRVLVDEINALAEPIYKQVTYPDGSSESVIDYMKEKFNCQIMMG